MKILITLERGLKMTINLYTEHRDKGLTKYNSFNYI